MKLTKEQAAANRRAIVEASVRSFKRDGVDAVGVSDIMKSAGFTHGGFYNHFESKEMLVAEAIAAAFAPSVAFVEHAACDEAAFDKSIDEHLSRKHRDDPANGCPTSTLVTDAARQGKLARRAYADGIKGYLDAFERRMEGEESPRAAAMSMLATMVGAMVLSRGIGDANDALSRDILRAARTKLADERQARRSVAKRKKAPR